jgi:HAD superfamily hydrolase (TIGR01549 family)
MNVDRIEFVYFDLDDTLLDHQRAEHRALGDVCTEYDEAFAELTEEAVRSAYRDHNSTLWQQYEAGEIDANELERRRFEQLLESLAVTGVQPARVNEHYLNCYAEHWALTKGSRAAFRAVAERYPVGILTNGFADTQRAKLDQFPQLRNRLDALVISAEVGTPKPHSAVFEYAAREADTEPGAILYVGNSLRSDVGGGLQADWQVAWYGGDPSRASDEVFCFEKWDALVRRLGLGDAALEEAA